MNWSVVLFGVWPYIALAVFVVGHIWRWRCDQLGWTTRTSELSEKRWLMWASPIFHLGMLLVIAGHALGLLVPPAATAALGISETAYHMVAVGAGVTAGLVLAVGVVLLVLRRFILRTRLRLVTRPGDVVVYALAVVVVAFGLWATFAANVAGPGYDYRETIAVWFRSIFYCQPQVDLMASAPWQYQVHVTAAWALIAAWPFSRLVHVWSAPLGYLTRPAIVYREQP
ncbi:MAG: respiratory nitrate reductase subunit gamma [Propionibacteriaceae bacterium]|jgi:nitrate reductase gamma subunit|nr:respiratory nitrate reductase subunit gamma [Propionibacteriaceae bacterium]